MVFLCQVNLTTQVNNDYIDEVKQRFFNCPDKPGSVPEARAVMVDMEPKVRYDFCKHSIDNVILRCFSFI